MQTPGSNQPDRLDYWLNLLKSSHSGGSCFSRRLLCTNTSSRKPSLEYLSTQLVRLGAEAFRLPTPPDAQPHTGRIPGDVAPMVHLRFKET